MTDFIDLSVKQIMIRDYPINAVSKNYVDLNVLDVNRYGGDDTYRATLHLTKTFGCLVLSTQILSIVCSDDPPYVRTRVVRIRAPHSLCKNNTDGAVKTEHHVLYSERCFRNKIDKKCQVNVPMFDNLYWLFQAAKIKERTKFSVTWSQLTNNFIINGTISFLKIVLRVHKADDVIKTIRTIKRGLFQFLEIPYVTIDRPVLYDNVPFTVNQVHGRMGVHETNLHYDVLVYAYPRNFFLNPLRYIDDLNVNSAYKWANDPDEVPEIEICKYCKNTNESYSKVDYVFRTGWLNVFLSKVTFILRPNIRYVNTFVNVPYLNVCLLKLTNIIISTISCGERVCKFS